MSVKGTNWVNPFGVSFLIARKPVASRSGRGTAGGAGKLAGECHGDGWGDGTGDGCGGVAGYDSSPMIHSVYCMFAALLRSLLNSSSHAADRTH